MEKVLAWEVIRQMSSQETRDFQTFLASPYYNTRQDMCDLFDFLAKKKKAIRPLTKNEVFKKVFPQKPFTEQEMRLLLSYLYRLLEKFLAVQNFHKNESSERKSLLSVFKQRNLNRHFRKTLNQAQKLHENSNQQHPEHYLEAYYLEREEYDILSSVGRTQELNLQQVEDNLDSAFISFKLRQACLARAHEAVFNTQYNIRLLQALLEIAQADDFQKNPAIVIYYYCYRALYDVPTEENFRLFREKLIELRPFFPQTEIRTLYLLAINYCIKQINKAKQSYLKEALDLYKSGLENDLLLENNRLSRFAFNNIVGIALHLDEYDWTEKFVQEYSQNLKIEYREAAFNLNSARLEYARKNYDNALVYLQKADYRDIISNMTAKILQMKIYYESDEFDLLYNHLKTMEMYVRRNKKISYHYPIWMNIIRYTQRISDINRYDKEAVDLLRQSIEGEEYLTEKKWLIGQL